MNTKPNTRGMTLIELVIVLALMAGLAGMALTTVGEMGNRARYDETTARLKLIREAVVGDGKAAGRFIRDMGRLPMVQDTDEGKLLSELWTAAAGTGYGSASEDMDDGSGPEWPDAFPSLPGTVSLHCGWNGPYTMVENPNDAQIFDGFGNDWQIHDGSRWKEGSGLAGGETIGRIRSLGSDGSDGGGQWDEMDQPVDLQGLLPDTELVVTLKALDRSSSPPVWRALVPAPAWAQSTAKTVGNCVVDAATSSHVFRCSTAGTTGGTEPTWNTDNVGDTTFDGAVEWEYLGPVSKLQHYVNRVRLALFVPEVGESSRAITWVYDWQATGSVQATVTLDGDNVTPGVRKVYAYAFLEGETSPRTIGTEPETVELLTGTNHITLYLR